MPNGARLDIDVRHPRRRTVLHPGRRRSIRVVRMWVGVAAATVLILPALPDGGAAAQAVADVRPGGARFVHESWTIEDGLPLNSIRQVLQSRDGYIWVATLDGLARFDGVRFTVFNSANSPGLPGNRLVRLWESSDGSLWLLTEAWELVRFRHGRFTRIGPEHGLTATVNTIHEDPEGGLWVGTGDGMGRIEGGRFVPVAEGDVGGVVRSMVRRGDGGLWVGADQRGIFRVEGGRAERVETSAALDTTTFWRMAEDSAGRLWLETGAGLWAEDGATGAGGPPVASRPGPLFHPRPRTVLATAGPRAWVVDGAAGLMQRPAVGGGVVPGAMDGEGTLWFVHDTRLFTRAGLAWDLNPAPGRPDPARQITALTVDREGSVWLGTWNAGLHRLKPALFTTYGESEGLVDRNASTVHQDGSGTIWIGTRSALNRVDEGGRITGWMNLAGRWSDVFSLLSDRADRLWVGTGGGLLSCALPAVSCRRVDSPAVPGHVAALHLDSRGRVWAGMYGSVAAHEDGRWSVPGGWPRTGVAGLVRAFAETGDGALWMGTNGDGVIRFHDGRFTRIDRSDGLPSDLVRALYLDGDGWLWVGTEGRGLARLDPRAWGGDPGRGDRRIVHIGTEDGLYDPVIHQILEDDAGRLWMSTNRGVFWVRRDELLAFADGRAPHVHSTHYTERDGMRNREANGGSQPAGTRTSDGRLWFPTQDGVVVVDPARVTEVPVPPPVVVERVAAGDTAFVPGAERIRLGVDQRNVEIQYTAPSFLEPGNMRFRYRLDPYDPDWVDAGGRRTAFYTRLPPGRYTFRVRASNHGDEWSEVEAPLQLGVAPRFHETLTARLLLGLTLVLLLAGGVQWRLHGLKRRERELSRVVDERTARLRRNEEELEARNAQLAMQAARLAELDQAKSRLFANLSHEFRTPLTLILGPLRSVLDGRHGSLPSGVREQGELMLRNGRRLLRLINQVLDLTKLESGQATLDRRPHDLVEFTRAVTLAFAPLAERRGIALRFHGERPALTLAFDAEQLEKVLLNLLSNALKFTGAGGRVEVVVGVEGDEAAIVVRDSGVGIAPGDLERVFERFYQTDASPTRRYEGTGIGLALSRQLVELHGGEIRAESTPGTGSTFTVRLPLGATMPDTDAEGTGRGSGATSLPLPERGAAPVPDAETLEAVLPDRDPVARGDGAGGPGDEADESGDEAGEDGADDRTTVLIVDDNPDVRAYVRSVLAASYRVIEAADGRAGLERARADLPDLIVADVMMPEMDGFALGRALKDDAMTDAIPVVLLTARAAPEDQVAGFETGADAYVVKPFEPAVLEARVAGLLEQRRRLRERFLSGEATPPASSASAPAVRSELEQRLRPLVEAKLMEPEFGPDALAEAAGLSYHQLYYALRKQLDTTPSRFIRGVRVECAAELLREGAGSVTEIAYSVGFQSLSYFSRAFRERFGTSPSEHLASPAPESPA